MRTKGNCIKTSTTSVLAAIALIMLMTLLSGCLSPNPTPNPTPSESAVLVHVLDVGEGLVVLIDDEEAEVVIDGGYKQYGQAFSSYIKPYVDGDIEYVIATHSHADHVGGLARIYADYQVGHTIYGDTGTSQQYRGFESAARSEPGSTFENDDTETIVLSEGVTLSIIDAIDGGRRWTPSPRRTKPRGYTSRIWSLC